MEKKDGATNKNDAEHTVEKIAYRIIPVPYYYPVPVDPEWYYENHERLSRQSERLFGFPEPHLEHFRPSFSRPRVREEYSLPDDRYENRERYRKSPLSRSSHINNREYEREYDRRQIDDEEKQIPIVKTSDSFNNGRTSRKNLKNNNGDTDDLDLSSDDCHSDKATSENGRNGQRKHYLMSFPYDQKDDESKTSEIDAMVVDDNQPSTPQESKQSTDSQKVEEQNDLKCEKKVKNIESKDLDRSLKPKYIYDGAHQPVIPSNVPYVVLKSSHSHDLMREPRYSMRDIDSPRYEPQYTHYSNSHSRASLEDSNEDMDKEMRYHSNGRRARTVFTRKQLMTLNNVFEKHPFVSGEKMSELSDQLGLDRKIVKIWFQNKRQYARKKGSLVEREDDYYYNYSHVFTSGTPTMAEKWKNGN
ncbi:uncharacterized protein LOC124815092 [Hydra vulgaris]|uniref:uncharacterized protein LOC124815092 n=1 Tax=Hydra vulgaris TaxID=6087 RepID=UPI0002B49AFD|nr:uncharacterized protein LOC124815092 [Hydra vulgaris]